MEIGGNFRAFDISAAGMKLQKKKLDLISENIANSNTTKTSTGLPYKRKTLEIEQVDTSRLAIQNTESAGIMKISGSNHFSTTPGIKGSKKNYDEISMKVVNDNTPGDKVYMPDHPDSNKDGYLDMPNVNIVTEMVDMVAATRSYEANLTAFSASKQIAKDSLEI
ncbi:MAG: flagellar basal body rod protein FlgC [bacterium]